MALSAGPVTITLGGELEFCRMGFGTLRVFSAGPDRGREVLKRAVELGVRLIDTADSYGSGAAENLIAEALHPYPDDLVIATKGGQVVVDGKPLANGSREHLRAACEASLGRLRLERIELYQLHHPDPEVPLEESLGALVELREEGKVRSIGLSNVYGPALDQALAQSGAVSLQNPYNVAHRRSDPELVACEREGVAFLPYFPVFAGALEEGGEALADIARARGTSPAQVALAWLLQRSSLMLPIPCTTSFEHLEENMAALELELSPEERERLDAVAAR